MMTQPQLQNPEITMFDVQGRDGIPGPRNNNFKKEKNSGSAVPEIIMFADVQGPRSSARNLECFIAPGS